MKRVWTEKDRRAAAALALALGVAAAPAALEAAGADPSRGYRPDPEFYLKKVPKPKEQGLVEREVTRYRSYPRLDRAYRLQRQGRLREARQEYLAYFDLVPGDVRVRLSYLALLDRMSLDAEVAAQADLILAKHPRFVPAQLFKALAQRKLGDEEGAFHILWQVGRQQEVRPEDRRFALSLAADSALSRRRYADAGKVLSALGEMEQRAPRFLDAATALEKAGRLKEALEACSAARRCAATPADRLAASLAYAETARKLELPEAARQGYQAALEADPGNRAALRALADLAYREQRYREAEKWMTLLKERGATPKEREFLANLYLKSRRKDLALRELQAVADQEGGKASVGTLALLAQLQESAGKLSESAATYQALLDRAPGQGELRLRYGNLLIRLERYPEAAEALARALPDLTAPRLAPAHEALSVAYEKDGKYGDAAREAEEALRLRAPADPQRPALLLRIASLLDSAGKSQEALAYLNRKDELKALSGELKGALHRERSAILEKQGESSQAAEELRASRKTESQIPAETLVRIAVLLGKGGRDEEALQYLNRALAQPSLAREQRRVALKEKAQLLERGKHPLEAAHELEKLPALGESGEVFFRIGNLYLAAGAPDTAIDYFSRVIKDPAATPDAVCSAVDGIGITRFRNGRWPEAAADFEKGARLCGDSWQRRYYAGLALYRLGRFEPALEQFLLADKQKRDPATLLSIALCHKELDRPGAAVHYLEVALNDDSRTPDQSKEICDTLGHLYAEEEAFDKAADAFRGSLAIRRDPVIVLKLARVLDRGNRSAEALKALQDVEADMLPPGEVVGFLDLKSGLLRKGGDTPQALALLEKAQKLDPTPRRSRTMGILCQEAGRNREALEHFRSAYEKEPLQDEYALSLGYAYLADGRPGDAIPVFEAVAGRNPDDWKVREELGYLCGRAGRNVQAAAWFRQALDRLPLGEENPEEPARWEEDARRLRGEIGKFTRTFSGAAYASYRVGKAQSTLVTSGAVAGLNGEVGLEGAWRPPKIGLIDDRVFELFARLFGSLKTDTVTYREDSTQAGIGVRYKLLQRENLWISGERLIGIGKDAADDWLARLLYSRGEGAEPAPSRSSSDYYLLYAEGDAYLRGTVAAYAELRKGRSFTLRPDTLVAPYLATDGRWQSGTAVGGKYLEGGAGVSLKHFFNGTRYLNYRNTFDLSVNYRHGIFYGQGAGTNSGQYDTVLFSAGLFF